MQITKKKHTQKEKETQRPKQQQTLGLLTLKLLAFPKNYHYFITQSMRREDWIQNVSVFVYACTIRSINRTEKLKERRRKI